MGTLLRFPENYCAAVTKKFGHLKRINCKSDNVKTFKTFLKPL